MDSKKICNVLGIEPEVEEEPSSNISTYVVDETNSSTKDDVEYVIKNTKGLIESSKSVLSQLESVAKQSETARIFEVYADLLRTSVDLNQKLVEIHQDKQGLGIDVQIEEDSSKDTDIILTNQQLKARLKEL